MSVMEIGNAAKSNWQRCQFPGEKPERPFQTSLWYDSTHPFRQGYTLFPPPLFNEAGITITRAMAPVASAGTKISADLAVATMKGRQGIYDIETRDGVLTKTALVKLPSWNLSIAIGVPVDSINAPVRQAMFRLAFGGVTFLALSLAAAGWLSRRLAKDIARFAEASSAIEQGKKAEIPSTIIKEIHMVGTVLSVTRERENKMAEALEAAVETQQKISEALDLAKRDH